MSSGQRAHVTINGISPSVGVMSHVTIMADYLLEKNPSNCGNILLHLVMSLKELLGRLFWLSNQSQV
jgi:hypothetical protein